jgi:cystathionine gamma-synthase
MMRTHKIYKNIEGKYIFTGYNASLQIISLVSSETPQHQKKWTSIHAILLDASTLPHAKQFWLHTGEGISSRRAEYCLSIFDSYDICHNAEWSDAIVFSSPGSDDKGTVAKNEIRDYVAVLISNPETTVARSDVFLYETGMKPIYETYRALLLAFETRKVRQIFMGAISKS